MSGAVVTRTSSYMTMICWTMSILLPKKCMAYSVGKGGNVLFTIRETHGLSFIGSSGSGKSTSHSLSRSCTCSRCRSSSSRSRLGMVYAPPGSGYTEPEDETSYYPDTYEPMMEYPGTMRPGRTPENQPFSSLPIQDTDPDPVPWPHFQEIEWHHQWGAPHEHAIPMEEFIEMENRWATAEEEAAMRAGVRRNVRERREMEELENASTNLILDDDDDDDEEDNDDDGTKLDLGEGVVNVLARADAVTTKTNNNVASSTDDDDDDDDDDDFLLDLGLDSDEKDDDDNDDEPAFRTDDNSPEGLLNAMQSMMDAVGQGDDDNDDDNDLVPDDVDDDLDLDLDLGLLDDVDVDDDDDDSSKGDDDDLTSLTMLDDDDDNTSDNDEEEDDQMVPLDDMIGSEDADDMGDSFDDGGYDIDDFEYDNDGGDMY